MQLSTYFHGNVPVIHIDGEVDHFTGGELERVADEALGDRGCIVLDLSRCPYMDSGGLAVLFSLLLRVRGQGTLGLVSPTADLRRILDITGITSDTSVRIFANEEDMRRSLGL